MPGHASECPIGLDWTKPLARQLGGRATWRGSGRGEPAIFYPTVAIYFVLLSLLLFLIDLPLSHYIGSAREHAYGLSTQHRTLDQTG
jgi:hypothetical protein